MLKPKTAAYCMISQFPNSEFRTSDFEFQNPEFYELVKKPRLVTFGQKIRKITKYY